jgi:membrane protease YdiL (CAAX protease family)
MGVAGLHRLSPHLRGHLLLFERRPMPAIPSAKFIVGAVILELACLTIVRPLSASVPLLVLFPALLALGVAFVRASGVRLAEFGLRPWHDWSLTEKSYVVQVLVVANVVFPLVLAPSILAKIGRTSMLGELGTVFVPYLFFGFYQEVVYRGLLQSGLERPLGAVSAVLVANTLFTFGPLHWTYVTSGSSSAMLMLALIFGIGLLFGTMYQRTRNLWLPACFHAIGNAYMTWGGGPLA